MIKFKLIFAVLATFGLGRPRVRSVLKNQFKFNMYY